MASDTRTPAILPSFPYPPEVVIWLLTGASSVLLSSGLEGDMFQRSVRTCHEPDAIVPFWEEISDGLVSAGTLVEAPSNMMVGCLDAVGDVYSAASKNLERPAIGSIPSVDADAHELAAWCRRRLAESPAESLLEALVAGVPAEDLDLDSGA